MKEPEEPITGETNDYVLLHLLIIVVICGIILIVNLIIK